MNPIPEIWLSLVAATACIAAIAAIACWRLARRCHLLVVRVDEQTRRQAALEKDLGAILSCSRRLGECLRSSEQARETLQRQIDKLRQLQDGDEHLPVNHAMQLLNTGVDVAEVVRICELSAGEADLLQSLARHRAVA
ncbi:MAG: DUF2802 domain-containing protein [Gammaproteobacteria bacterium]